MKKLLFSTILLAALLLAACGDTDDEATPQEHVVAVEPAPDPAVQDDKQIDLGELTGDAAYMRDGSLVHIFYEPDTLLASFHSTSKRFNELGFSLYTQIYSIDRIVPGTRWATGSDKHTMYINYYGDTTYHHVQSIGDECYACAMPLNAINVTADRDFDAEHPAGSLLNDLFIYAFSSAYNIIKSNYSDSLDIRFYDDRILEDDWYKYEKVPLSEMEPLNLLHDESFLYFTKLPETLGEYTFTISLEYGADPVSGREAKKIAPAVVKAEFTDKDYVYVPVHEPLNKGE